MNKPQYLKDSDPRFRWLGWRVLSFAGLVLLAVVVLAVTLGVQQGLFRGKERIHFVAESGSGLVPGMQVRLSGFRIGVADEVSLNEQAKVDVTLLVEEQYMKWLKADSFAILQQEGLIGDHFIEISGGSAKAVQLKEGDKIEFIRTLGMADIALDLREKTLPIISSVQQTFDYLNDPKGEVRKMLVNVEALTSEVRGTREKLDILLARIDGVVDVEGRATLRSADQLLKRADSVANELNAKMSPVLQGAASIVVSADSAAKDAGATMSVLRHSVEQAAPTLPSVVRNADELLYGGRQTLDGLQQSWPLKNMLTPVELVAPQPESRR